MQAKSRLEGSETLTESGAADERNRLLTSDSDPTETTEWIEAWDQILDEEGPDRAAYLLHTLASRSRAAGLDLPPKVSTPYLNTIREEDELPYPGDRALERRIKGLIRWNAIAMVVQQNKKDSA